MNDDLFMLLCLLLCNHFDPGAACCKKVSVDTTTPPPLSPCFQFELLTRAEWGARTRRHNASYIVGAVNMTFVHHTAWNTCLDRDSCVREVRKVQDYHMDSRGWDDIGYTFMIGDDGRVYEGRGWTVVGAHTLHYNSVSYGMCIMFNFMDVVPSGAALQTLKALIECGITKGYITSDYKLYGHRDAGCTLCPGDNLFNIIQTWPHFRTRPVYNGTDC